MLAACGRPGPPAPAPALRATTALEPRAPCRPLTRPVLPRSRPAGNTLPCLFGKVREADQQRCLSNWHTLALSARKAAVKAKAGTGAHLEAGRERNHLQGRSHCGQKSLPSVCGAEGVPCGGRRPGWRPEHLTVWAAKHHRSGGGGGSSVPANRVVPLPVSVCTGWPGLRLARCRAIPAATDAGHLCWLGERHGLAALAQEGRRAMVWTRPRPDCGVPLARAERSSISGQRGFLQDFMCLWELTEIPGTGGEGAREGGRERKGRHSHAHTRAHAETHRQRHGESQQGGDRERERDKERALCCMAFLVLSPAVHL